jgi:small subunit ribosomal protein S15
MRYFMALWMARIHAHTHGRSHSTRPSSHNLPSWVSNNPSDLSSIIIQFSKDGLSPSEIGTKLRDVHGVPLAKQILGKSITHILTDNNIVTELPEDLSQLVKKALGLQKHLRSHNTDRRNIRSLELIEAKIHRLSKYYKRIGKLQKKWKYAAIIAQLE